MHRIPIFLWLLQPVLSLVTLPPLNPTPQFLQQLNQEDGLAVMDIDPADDFIGMQYVTKISPYVRRETSLPIELNSNQKYMKMGNARYLCNFPTAGHSQAIPLSQNDSTQTISRSRAAALLHPMSDGCLYSNKGYWSYSFCYQRHVEQYHEPAKEGDISERYLLGRFDPVATNTEIEFRPSNAFVQKYTDGDSCDLNNQPRQTEVRIICRSNMPDEILDVNEVATCKYLITVGTSKLCSDPHYKSKQRSLSVIECTKYAPNSQLQSVEALPQPAASKEFEKLRQTPIQDSGTIFDSLMKSIKRSVSKEFPFQAFVFDGDDEFLSSNLHKLLDDLEEELLGDDNERDDNAAISLLKKLLKTRKSQSSDTRDDTDQNDRKTREKKTKIQK